MNTKKKKGNASATGHTQKAYMGIRKMLFHNEISPGQKISYRDLSERLGMSQTPVIQALKWLEYQKLVRHEPNRGYYTAPISLREVEEIYDFRELIELSLLKKTMRRLDFKGLERLESALQAHITATREVYIYDRLLKDMEFHLTLASLSQCEVQEQALRNLFDLLYLKYGASILFSTSMEMVAADHTSLVDGIRSGDFQVAGDVLSDHLRKVRDHVMNGLKRSIEEKKLTTV